MTPRWWLDLLDAAIERVFFAEENAIYVRHSTRRTGSSEAPVTAAPAVPIPRVGTAGT